MKNLKGFSLIELLTTLTIMMIVLFFGIPAFKHMVSQTSSVAAGNKLISIINFVRGESVHSGKALTLCGTQDFKHCSQRRDWGHRLMVFHDANRDLQINDNEKKLRVFNFEKDSDVRWRSFRNKTYLNFYPSSETYYQNGNFTYCPGNKNAKYARHYILNATGRLYPARKDKNNNGVVEGRNGKDIEC